MVILYWGLINVFVAQFIPNVNRIVSYCEMVHLEYEYVKVLGIYLI